MTMESTMSVAQLYLMLTVIGGILALILFFFPLAELLDFFNPLEWLVSITILGASGYILTRYTEHTPVIVFCISLGVAVICYLVLHYFILTPLEQAESSLVYSEKELEGKVAEVITSIPHNGYGEIMISSPSGTKSIMAKSFDKSNIPLQSKVVIVAVEKGVAYVTPFEKNQT